MSVYTESVFPSRTRLPPSDVVLVFDDRTSIFPFFRLPHGDGAEWAPTSTKTNVLGSDTGTTAGSTASLDVRDLTPNPPPRILSQPYDQAYDTPSVGTAEKPGSLLVRQLRHCLGRKIG